MIRGIQAELLVLETSNLVHILLIPSGRCHLFFKVRGHDIVKRSYYMYHFVWKCCRQNIGQTAGMNPSKLFFVIKIDRHNIKV
jgi:hypothetical protein